MPTGLIFDIKRYCVHDGPNIRSTVFLKGCPLECWWCHNPEGRERTPQVVHRESRCIRCGMCTRACDTGALVKNGKGVGIDRELCDLCGACEEACPTGSMEIVGRKYEPQELVDLLERDRVFYEESGGGVTFSGGEPLAQWRFLAEALKECRKRGLHTAVDTSGFATQEVIDAVRPHTDLWLYDLKLMDDARHKRYTGVSNRRILQNLEHLVKAGCRVTLVIPLIPGINDDAQNLDALAEFALGLGLSEIGVLPYHRMGASKLDMVGYEDRMLDVSEPSQADVLKAADRLTAHGMHVKIGAR